MQEVSPLEASEKVARGSRLGVGFLRHSGFAIIDHLVSHVLAIHSKIGDNHKSISFLVFDFLVFHFLSNSIGFWNAFVQGL